MIAKEADGILVLGLAKRQLWAAGRKNYTKLTGQGEQEEGPTLFCSCSLQSV